MNIDELVVGEVFDPSDYKVEWKNTSGEKPFPQLKTEHTGISVGLQLPIAVGEAVCFSKSSDKDGNHLKALQLTQHLWQVIEVTYPD